MKRCELLELADTSADGLLLPACATSTALKLDANLSDTFDQRPYRRLALSLPEEQDYEALIEGKIPIDLPGIYFCYGPGLFDRDGVRKRTILDGDGMVQSFRFHINGFHHRAAVMGRGGY